MIKAQSGIRKSGILSPWRNPLDPSDRFYRRVSAITRAIMNFNGTQYATLSEPVVLDGDFEIEVLAEAYQHTGVYFAEDADYANDNNRIGINGSGELVLKFDGNFANLGTVPSIAIGNISRYTIKRIDGGLEFLVNGESIVSDTVNSTFYVQQFLKNWVGSVFSFRIWKDGDRNSGELVTNLRFDEPNTTLQRNYAYPNSNFLYNSKTDDPFPVRTGASAGEGVITTLPNGAWELRRADNYTENTITARTDFVDLPPGKYKFNFEGARNGDVVFMIRRRSNGTDYAFLPLNTTREGWFDHDDPQGLYIQIQINYPSEDSFARIDKLIIQEWDGAILNNVLPGDWEKISKKSGDDFWTGDGGRVIEYAEGVL